MAWASPGRVAERRRAAVIELIVAALLFAIADVPLGVLGSVIAIGLLIYACLGRR